MSVFCKVDDKHVPLYRIMWISALPHFCGDEDCQCEGKYEIRLEQGESVWANAEERDGTLTAIANWQTGLDAAPDEPEDWDE